MYSAGFCPHWSEVVSPNHHTAIFTTTHKSNKHYIRCKCIAFWLKAYHWGSHHSDNSGQNPAVYINTQCEILYYVTCRGQSTVWSYQTACPHLILFICQQLIASVSNVAVFHGILCAQSAVTGSTVSLVHWRIRGVGRIKN